MSINMQKHIGEKHGRLTIIERIPNTGKPKYLCKCECGNYVKVEYGSLTKSYGGTRSCGCYRKDRVTKHGGGHNRMYRIYHAMLTRTTNPNFSEYKNYGGKGITVCNEWLGEHGFEHFREWSLNHGYSDKLTIDRIDNDKGYSPDNCRWATRQEQADNKTTTIKITFNGETKTLSEWAKILNIKRMTLYCRIFSYGWDIEKALSTPIKK